AGLVEDIMSDAIASGSLEPCESARLDAAPTTVLPLLEFALAELWQSRHEGELTRASYRAMGGMTGVLARRCDRVFAELSEGQQSIAQRLLADLVDDPADTHPELPPTRRRRRLSQLPESLRGDPKLPEVARFIADQ